MEKKFTSVEELDAYLETLTADDIKDDEVDEEIDPNIQTEVDITHVEEEVVEDTTEEVDEADEELDEEANDDLDEEVEEPEPKKETKEEKQERQRNYALGKMRKEKAEAIARANALEEKTKALEELTNRLMKESGYSDLKEFKNAVETQLSEKEMKEKGYTKEQYEEVVRVRKENEILKAQLNQRDFSSKQEKARQFNDLVISYADKAKVSTKDVYGSLESQGYTVDMLLSQPNPEILIKGILADKLTVVRQVVKKQVDTQKLTSKGNTSSTKVDLDELVRQDLEDFYKGKR